ncbi:nucleoside-diphosphate-sugar epimerase [Nitrosospira sp. Nsp5]|uniref:Nucleoside-diphosphate-sugar epimerase n=1 Tax=Nitrosospira multiformis TaxID=1231 RepID=A0ABY0T681_9PROT|nr:MULTISPECIES: NAD(P)-dependent oxidoreductase [Nitrosospira]PTR05151.1 nucleoside-diphosphate-sugar epimerase [Nitrosospira sp. Nsp5]SDQ31284.1 Nucleoside-diphosphate-sugar epimerase [Nitrosospira multiformis]
MSGSWVAVTGATGFIGSVLLQSLIKEGWKIKALARRPRANDEFTQWIEGDLDNLDALQSLVENVSAVVHCAGRVRGSSLDDFIATNVAGTSNLVRASIQQASPPRFLLISSLAARQPELSWYATSKRMAEQLVIDHSHVMPCAVFRPTAVYGPGDKEMSPLFRVTQRGILPMVGQAAMRFGLLHVNDLVAAILCWLSTEAPVNGIYELDDGLPGGYDSQTVAAIAQDVWKRPVRCLFLPAPLVSLVANINLWSARLLRYSPMLTPGKVRELRHPDWVCDITPLTQALPNWRPRIRLRDALPQAI